MGGMDGNGEWKDFRDAMNRMAGKAEDAMDRAGDAMDRAFQGMDRAFEGMERSFEGMERRMDEMFGDKPAPKAGRHAPRPDVSGAGRAAAGGTGTGESVHRNFGEAPGTGDGQPRDPAGLAPGAEEPSKASEADAADARRRGFGSRIADGYAAVVEKARSGVSGAVSKGAEAIDGAAGDAPWRLAGLDERKTRIAREVMREVVPKVAGDRVASALDGAAMKGGVAGAGLLLRIPLKGFAVPFLLGVTAVETVRAVKDVRSSIADIAARVDNEARSAEAYRTGAGAP